MLQTDWPEKIVWILTIYILKRKLVQILAMAYMGMKGVGIVALDKVRLTRGVGSDDPALA